MAYNLLTEAWIPVRRQSGAVTDIAPHHLVDSTDPPVSIASPRPDFDGALIQFLIGLVQTVLTPRDGDEWLDRWEKPPTTEELRRLLEPIRPAFNLDGDGPRFMQDLTLTEQEASDSPAIGALLIDRQGEPDEATPGLFCKPGGFESMGNPALAMALYTLQSNAPGGGRGHRVSLRGGGPLSVVLLGETLWQTVWLNVLTRPQFEKRGKIDLNKIEDQFPWMGPTRTSKNGEVITPGDLHPAHLYWAMPRRIRVDFSEASEGVCSITRRPGRVIHRYFTKDNGFNYKGAFLHPLTPYTRMKAGSDEPPNPRKGSAAAVAYTNWPNLAGRADEEHIPAGAVSEYLDPQKQAGKQQAQRRLWVFGYRLDNMKAEGWYQGTVPVFASSHLAPNDLLTLAQFLVDASEEVRKTTVAQSKAAVFRRPEDARGDFPGQVNLAFRSATEPEFYRAVAELASGAPADPIRESWLATLGAAAKSVFRANSQLSAGMSALDVRRVATAWNKLVRFTSPRSRTLRAAIGLPQLEKTSKNPKGSEASP